MEPCRHVGADRPCSSPDALSGRGCLAPPEWEVYAAYDLPADHNVHPGLARYPGAMFVACGLHLPILIRADAAAEGSTNQWVVKPFGAH